MTASVRAFGLAMAFWAVLAGGFAPDTAAARRDDPPSLPQALPVPDLPLIEAPAKSPATQTLAVILSGDGGWAKIDQVMSDTLCANGVSVVGLNSLRYFWKERTPDGVAADLARVLRYYLKSWNKERALLVGYSRGADAVALSAGRLPPELLSRVDLFAFLGLGKQAALEIHVGDFLKFGAAGHVYDTRPEVEKLRGRKILCFYGDSEDDSLCPALDRGLAISIGLKGDHHFDRNYAALAETILKESGLKAPSGTGAAPK